MVYTDEDLRVANSQAVTVTAVSASSIDLGSAENANQEVGEGEALKAFISTQVAAAAAGAATVTFEIITADDAALTSNVTVRGSSGPIGKADLIPTGHPVIVRQNPVPGNLGQRYLGVRFTVATGPLTAGTFTADFVKDIQGDNKHYASGYTVL